VPYARDDKGDRELLTSLAAGEPQALGDLYDRHAASLFRHALALTRRRPEAEDLVHAVFVKLATTGAALLDVRAPAHYMHRTLHTTWIDAQRRTMTGARVVESVATPAYAWQTGGADAIDLSSALDALPAAQREVIVLHLIEGFSFREVGRLTGVSMFTAAARYRLAIGRMKARLTRPSGLAHPIVRTEDDL
jgi:RNA polymerase sigma-70 factor (ECF subfamily)